MTKYEVIFMIESYIFDDVQTSYRWTSIMTGSFEYDSMRTWVIDELIAYIINFKTDDGYKALFSFYRMFKRFHILAGRKSNSVFKQGCSICEDLLEEIRSSL